MDSGRMDNTGAETVAPSLESPITPAPKRAKRTRTQLACQRCRVRKQKCNGHKPECSNCARLNVECSFSIRSEPTPEDTKTHIKALETRLAELESAMTRGGSLADVAVDHWTQRQKDEALKEKEYGQDLDEPLNSSGPFVGGTSTITLARMLESILVGKGREQLAFQQAGLIPCPDENSMEYSAESESRDLRSRIPTDSIVPDGPPPNALRGLHSSIADKLLLAYFNHVVINFPVLHSVQIKDLHRRRDIIDDPYEESILSLVYALGGQFLEATGELGDFQWRNHYEAALEKRDIILQFGGTRALAYLLLLIQQCLRVPRDPGGWTFIGVAMRLCVELGLHRKKRGKVVPTLESELEKRLFWTCYYCDRDIAVALGRPPSINDHDINVELPLDVDEECQDPEVFTRARQSDTPANPSTTLTCFVHTLRLKRIESKVQYKIYRVDVSVENLQYETELFLTALAAWKDAIPPQNHPRDVINHNAYMLYYYKCIRLLLQPQLYETEINERYLTLCTEACVGVCDTYRRLHDHSTVAFSTISIQTIFLAGEVLSLHIFPWLFASFLRINDLLLQGLTLVYCMWHAPSITAIKSMSALSDCSIMLYLMTERWPNIKRYRDAFEAIKRTVLYLIAEEKHEPRKVIPAIIGDVWSSLQSLDYDMIGEINHSELEQMFDDVTRERMQFPAWDSMDINMYDSLDMGNENLNL